MAKITGLGICPRLQGRPPSAVLCMEGRPDGYVWSVCVCAYDCILMPLNTAPVEDGMHFELVSGQHSRRQTRPEPEQEQQRRAGRAGEGNLFLDKNTNTDAARFDSPV